MLITLIFLRQGKQYKEKFEENEIIENVIKKMLAKWGMEKLDITPETCTFSYGAKLLNDPKRLNQTIEDIGLEDDERIMFNLTTEIILGYYIYN
jgi:hypothetical protein